MEREITLSSFAVKNQRGNRPGDFTTRFTPTIQLGNDASYYIGFNRIISMFFSWTNVNEGYNNQKIAFSKDDGRTWTDIDFAKGVWTYHDLDKYIKEETKTIDGEGNEDYPITLNFDSFGTSTLRASYGFVLEPRRVIFNPVNKKSISSIRIYITDGLRRPVYLNNADTAFSLILKMGVQPHLPYPMHK